MLASLACSALYLISLADMTPGTRKLFFFIYFIILILYSMSMFTSPRLIGHFASILSHVFDRNYLSIYFHPLHAVIKHFLYIALSCSGLYVYRSMLGVNKFKPYNKTFYHPLLIQIEENCILIPSVEKVFVALLIAC